MILSEVVSRLRQFYGRLPEPPDDPFAYFVWEVLSAESAPSKRDAAFTALRKIPALTPDAMHRAPPAQIVAAIALAGPYRERRLDALAIGVDRFRRVPTLSGTIRGPLSAASRALRSFPNLGRGGARRILLFAGNHAVVPRDARIERVATRIGFVSPTLDPNGRRRLINRLLRPELGSDIKTLRQTSLYLAHHGSVTCPERDPHCGVCPIARDCSYHEETVRRVRL